ncbi:MAG: hypothetical protein QW279_09700 [Candidatus Jordarchaeaceae archaeon]
MSKAAIDKEIENELENLKQKRIKIFKTYTHYLDRLNKICDHVINKWLDADSKTNADIKALLYFPAHDYTHCVYVEKTLYELLPEDHFDDLSEEEWFYLIASVWLHDIGMLPDPFEREVDEKQKGGEEKQRAVDEKQKGGEEKQRAVDEKWIEYVRKEHYKRSKKYIEIYRGELELNPDYHEKLKKICVHHKLDDYKGLIELQKEEGGPTQTDVRCSLLLSYLRLAEALFKPKKGAKEDSRLILSLGLDFMSKLHWIKSKYFDVIKPDLENHKITIKIKVPEPQKSTEENWEVKIKPLELQMKRRYQDQIDVTKEIIIKNIPPPECAIVNGKASKITKNLPFYSEVEIKPVTINMTPDEKIELECVLADIVLSDPVVTPNASSLIDAVLKQVSFLIEESDPYKRYMYLNYYKTKILDKKLKERPCHEFLRKICRLIERNESNFPKIKSKLEQWKNKIQDIKKDLPASAKGTISANPKILLYGYSNSVIMCLDALSPEKKKEVEVYVCEAATKKDHRYNNRLVYCDGLKYIEELKKIGIEKIYYVPDACVANLCSEIKDETKKVVKEKKVDAVLFGANGIDLDGNVYHALGHLTIAKIAKEYNIPVYVIADSLKIGYPKANPELQRDVKWLTTDIDFEHILEHEKAKIESYNPREDVVPNELINGIITEHGVYGPKGIRGQYEKDLEKEKKEGPVIICTEKDTGQCGIIGKTIIDTPKGKYLDRIVKLDLSTPRIVLVIGNPRTGKGYTIGVIAENLLDKIQNISNIEKGATVIVFHNPPSNEASGLVSLGQENNDPKQIKELGSEYSAKPKKLVENNKIRIFLLPDVYKNPGKKGIIEGEYKAINPDISSSNIFLLDESFLDNLAVRGVNILDFRISNQDASTTPSLMAYTLDKLVNGKKEKFSNEIFVLIINEAHHSFIVPSKGSIKYTDFADKVAEVCRITEGHAEMWLLIDTQKHTDIPQDLITWSKIKIIHKSDTAVASAFGIPSPLLEKLDTGEAIICAEKSSEIPNTPIRVKIRPRVTRHVR